MGEKGDLGLWIKGLCMMVEAFELSSKKYIYPNYKGNMGAHYDIVVTALSTAVHLMSSRIVRS